MYFVAQDSLSLSLAIIYIYIYNIVTYARTFGFIVLHSNACPYVCAFRVTRVCMYVCMYIYICMYVCMYVCKYVSM